MTECVIDAFEVVQIKEQDGEPLHVAPCFGCGPVQVVFEHQAIGKAGEAVMVGHVTDLFMIMMQVFPHFPEGCCQFANLVIGIDINRYQHLPLAYFTGGQFEFPDRADKQLSQNAEQKRSGQQDGGRRDEGNCPAKTDALVRQFVFLMNDKGKQPVM